MEKLYQEIPTDEVVSLFYIWNNMGPEGEDSPPNRD